MTRSPSSLWGEAGSQPYPELVITPDVGEKPGNHQMRCIVLSGLETQWYREGAQAGRNGGTLVGGVMGSAETEPALEFSEVGN